MSDRRKWFPLVILLLLVELTIVALAPPGFFNGIDPDDIVDKDGNLLIHVGTEAEMIDADAVSPLQVGMRILWIGLFVLLVVLMIWIILSFRKKGSGAAKPSPRSTPGFRPDAKDHEHITTASLSLDKSHELQQLESMREAGLITEEEYRERRKQIKP